MLLSSPALHKEEDSTEVEAASPRIEVGTRGGVAVSPHIEVGTRGGVAVSPHTVETRGGMAASLHIEETRGDMAAGSREVTGCPNQGASKDQEDMGLGEEDRRIGATDRTPSIPDV